MVKKPPELSKVELSELFLGKLIKNLNEANIPFTATNSGLEFGSKTTQRRALKAVRKTLDELKALGYRHGKGK